MTYFWANQGEHDHCPIQLFHPGRSIWTVFATSYAPLAIGPAHRDGNSRFGCLAGRIAERIERRATTEGRLGASAFTTDAACAVLLSLGFAIC